MYYPLSWNKLHTLSYHLAQKIKKEGTSYDVIVTIARGGLALSNMLADFLQIPVAAFTVTTYKNMEKTAEPEIKFGVSPEIKDQNILLFDDIADTGDTLKFGKNYLLQNGANNVETATLFYKPHSSVKPDFYAEEVTEWVIFPFEIEETISVYQKLLEKDQDKANELWKNILKLELPTTLLNDLKAQ